MRSDARGERRPGGGGAIILLILVAVVNLFPFVWGALTSLKPARELMAYPPKLFGSYIDWSHHITVLNGSITQAALNSFLYCLVSVAVGLVLANLCAYGMTRYKFRGRQFLFYLILAGIPLSVGSAAMVVPN